MGAIYLRCDLICSCSSLVLVLRAISNTSGPAGGASDECVAVAREVMDIHQQCMITVSKSRGKSSMLHKYINW